MKTHWARPEFHEMFISLSKNHELLIDFSTSNLRYILKEIVNEVKKCDNNPNHIFPSISIASHSKYKSSDFIAEKDIDLVVKLRREYCYETIKVISKRIKKELKIRYSKSKIKYLDLEAHDLADLVYKYNLPKDMDKTEIVNFIFEIREEKIPKRPQNTSLYKKL